MGKNKYFTKSYKKNIFIIFIISVVFSVLIVFLELNSNFKDSLAVFYTSLSGLSVTQKNNIIKTSYIINQTRLSPGETFSFNKIVGPRSLERGYLKDKVIFEGSEDISIGGGICLVSSSLYNVALLSGMKIIKRVPHYTTVNSVSPGRDATVWYGKVDLVFKNILNKPIIIKMSIDNNCLKSEIFGKKSNKIFKIKTIILDIIPFKKRIIYDSNLPKRKKVILPGKNGYKVRVVRETFIKDKKINSEIISEDFYHPIPSIIKIGE